MRLRPEQAADAEQREAEAELDAGAELRGDDDQQREALRAVRHLRRDEADRLERDEVGERQLERAGVLAASGSR